APDGAQRNPGLRRAVAFEPWKGVETIVPNDGPIPHVLSIECNSRIDVCPGLRASQRDPRLRRPSRAFDFAFSANPGFRCASSWAAVRRPSRAKNGCRVAGPK